jgi:hypothetical protein
VSVPVIGVLLTVCDGADHEITAQCETVPEQAPVGAGATGIVTVILMRDTSERAPLAKTGNRIPTIKSKRNAKIKYPHRILALIFISPLTGL